MANREGVEGHSHPSDSWAFAVLGPTHVAYLSQALEHIYISMRPSPSALEVVGLCGRLAVLIHQPDCIWVGTLTHHIRTLSVIHIHVAGALCLRLSAQLVSAFHIL